MLTDGEADISDQRFAELTGTVESVHAKFYVVGIGPDWMTSDDTVDLRTFTETVGGKVIPVNDSVQLTNAFMEIDQLEKSTVLLSDRSIMVDISYWFILAALGCSFAFMALAAVVRDEV